MPPPRTAIVRPEHVGTDAVTAMRIVIVGRVQGVGFRPFLYRAAHRVGILGHVRNQHGPVEILAQGNVGGLDSFIDYLLDNAPPLARPRLMLREAALPTGLGSF